jgi:hypothetical protein
MNGEERDQVSQSAGMDPRAGPPSSEETKPLPVVDTTRVTRVSRPAEEPRASKPMEETRATQPVEDLPPLFGPEALTDFRRRWDAVQSGFVDDPKASVHAADEMVTEITHGLATRFAEQRASLESKFQHSEGPSTENLRLALRQYRSFFERLLSL